MERHNKPGVYVYDLVGSLIAHCDVCSKCKPDDLSFIIGKHAHPTQYMCLSVCLSINSKAKDELATLSVEKSKFYYRVTEISFGPCCGNI